MPYHQTSGGTVVIQVVSMSVLDSRSDSQLFKSWSLLSFVSSLGKKHYSTGLLFTKVCMNGFWQIVGIHVNLTKMLGGNLQWTGTSYTGGLEQYSCHVVTSLQQKRYMYVPAIVTRYVFLKTSN